MNRRYLNPRACKVRMVLAGQRLATIAPDVNVEATCLGHYLNGVRRAPLDVIERLAMRLGCRPEDLCDAPPDDARVAAALAALRA